MKPCKIIQLLRTDNSKLFKLDILSKNMDNEEFVEGLKYALTPLITYGTKDVPPITDHYRAYTYNEELSQSTWPKFKELLDKLISRELTGHAARDAIIEIEEGCCSDTWNDWYRPILLKDFKAGFSERSVNKVAKGTIQVFGCMLAKDGKDGKGLVGECLIENKYDGVRCIAIVQNNTAVLHSRNGKVFPNFPHIEAALSKPEFNNMVFDGEIMSENFQALMKQVYRKSDVQTEDAYLALFDVLDLAEFNAGKGACNTIERKQILAELPFDQCIRKVDFTRVNLDTEEGQQIFKNMNKIAIAEGYEGLMVKPVGSIYECKRSASWLKIKPIIEVTLTIIDIEEGQGKFEGTTGALVCEGIEDGDLIGVNVGSGLTDEMRESIWNNRDDVIGQLVEIRADAITQAENGEYSLRFPRFKTFRGFEIGEKL
jgi:DNA ligase 1